MNNHGQKKILPISIPPFAVDPNDAYINSALMCYEECESWFCRNFIMLYSFYSKEKKLFGINYIQYYKFIQWANCLWLRTQMIKRDYILDKWGSFTNFVKHMIDDEYYVCFLGNSYHIEPAVVFKKDIYYHQTLIYGYDNHKKIFEVADFIFNESNAFCTAKTSMKSIELAFRDVDKNKINSYESHHELDQKIRLFKVDFNRFKECRNINISFVKQQLEEFLNSSPIDNYWMPGKDAIKLENKYGLEVYNLIIENLDDIIYDFNPGKKFYTIYAHKEAMIYRLRILSKYNLLGNSNQIINKYVHIKDTAKTFVNLYIKYFIKKDKNLIDKMKEKLIYIKDHEKNIVKEILVNLNCKVAND